MGVIDTDYLTKALLSAAEEGVKDGLEVIQSRARKHAPVRDIFKHSHGKSGGSRADRAGEIAAIINMAERWGAKGPPTSLSARSVNLRNFGMTSGGGMASHRGRELWKSEADYSVHEPSPFTMTGRANSYHPVIQSPVGRIGAKNMRNWAGPGLLEIGVIREAGKEFLLSDLLSARGRYEAFGRANERIIGGKNKSGREGRGRAVRKGEYGEMMIGGRLRDSIVPEGPFHRGNEVYGFVRAAAADPGSSHNYAADQEFGTRHNRAQPFLRPGLRESKERIIKLVSPGSKAHKGTIQRAFEMGKRPAASGTGGGAGVPIRLRIKAEGWENLATRLLSDLGLGR